MSRCRTTLLALVAVVLVGSATVQCGSDEPPTRVPTVADELRVPWGVDFLPDGSALVTERDTGRVLAVREGAVSEVARIEQARPSSEGGLLGIAVSPDYESDGQVFVYYSTAEDNRIARMRLGGVPEPIVTGIPKSSVHNGGRVEFGPDGMLYATTGDGSERATAQQLDSLGGKILRMTPDGTPAPGNPFPGSLVYSYGHRNVQGIDWDARGRMFAAEFGQNTWDELNRIEPGKNYGWPTCEGDCENSAQQNAPVDPLLTWTPEEASPSGIAIRDDVVYLAGLRGERLLRARLEPDGTASKLKPRFDDEFGRLRTPVVTPAGELWVTTSNTDGRGDPGAGDDKILRLPVAQSESHARSSRGDRPEDGQDLPSTLAAS